MLKVLVVLVEIKDKKVRLVLQHQKDKKVKKDRLEQMVVLVLMDQKVRKVR